MEKTFGGKKFSKKRKENFRIRFLFIFELKTDGKTFHKDGMEQGILKDKNFFGAFSICIYSVSYQVLRKKSSSGLKGDGMNDILGTAERFGIRAEPVRADGENMS